MKNITSLRTTLLAALAAISLSMGVGCAGSTVGAPSQTPRWTQERSPDVNPRVELRQDVKAVNRG